MRPTDVDKIASAVVSTLSGSDPGLLGCGSVSSAQQFDVDNLECDPSYQCGGAAPFLCLFEFDCGSGPGPFYCGPSGPTTIEFECPRQFSCDTAGAFF